MGASWSRLVRPGIIRSLTWVRAGEHVTSVSLSLSLSFLVKIMITGKKGLKFKLR